MLNVTWSSALTGSKVCCLDWRRNHCTVLPPHGVQCARTGHTSWWWTPGPGRWSRSSCSSPGCWWSCSSPACWSGSSTARGLAPLWGSVCHSKDCYLEEDFLINHSRMHLPTYNTVVNHLDLVFIVGVRGFIVRRLVSSRGGLEVANYRNN